MMNDSGYRGLSERCFQIIKADDGLQRLLERISRDPDYRLEVRRNYLNCCYQSGAVFKLKFKVKDQRLRFEFNPNYFSLKDTLGSAHKDLLNWVRRGPNEPREWLDNLDEIREVMDAWMENNPCEEAKSQQALTGCSTLGTAAVSICTPAATPTWTPSPGS